MENSCMVIQIKLMGAFKYKTPTDGKLELPDSASVTAALTALGIADERVQVLTINGSMIRDRAHPLSDGDEMTVIPPVGGG